MKKPAFIFITLLIGLTSCAERQKESAAEIASSKHQLLQRFTEFDSLFSMDKGSELADLFSEDARIIWPYNNDIVGRDAIRKAWIGFAKTFHTISWRPQRENIHILDNKAFLFYRFIEIRTFRKTGEIDTTYGRSSEMWQKEYDGLWYNKIIMTSRYKE